MKEKVLHRGKVGRKVWGSQREGDAKSKQKFVDNQVDFTPHKC